LQRLASHWYSTVGVSNERVAEQIRTDEIDILVDLAGHTGGNRLPVFTYKPAPIQITYLGYPATTGLSQIDYRLTDVWADPPINQEDDCYTEKLIRLPGCFLCFNPPTSAPEISVLPALTSDTVMFGSFNNLAKTNLSVVNLWAAILSVLPTAEIILKTKSFCDEATRNQYLDLFAAQGIERKRIHLVGHLPQSQDHLALYGKIDIGLDTFPYNGTTTTCEALWLGVPVITLAGNSHPGRVGVSILSAVGLENLIADTPEAYIAKAIELASNVEQLSNLRHNLRQRMAQSPLCDAPTFVQGLEDSYRQFWQQWCANPQ
jgi:protein O-GlcNAc transferase